MTKPHEETWFVEADGPEVEVHRVGGSVCDLNGPHARTPDDFARAKLIAQAPAMARLLLELEWRGEFQSETCCPACCGTKAHAPDCALAAVLRAAGVLP